MVRTLWGQAKVSADDTYSLGRKQRVTFTDIEEVQSEMGTERTLVLD